MLVPNADKRPCPTQSQPCQPHLSLLACMQERTPQACQRLCSVQSEMASIVAAAVHKGLVSVAEGVCEGLECEASAQPHADQGLAWSPEQGSQWGRLILEHYTDPDLPGDS